MPEIDTNSDAAPVVRVPRFQPGEVVTNKHGSGPWVVRQVYDCGVAFRVLVATIEKSASTMSFGFQTADERMINEDELIAARAVF